MSSVTWAANCISGVVWLEVEAVVWGREEAQIGSVSVFLVFVVIVAIGFIVVGISKGKSSLMSSTLAVDCVSGVGLLRVEVVSLEWWELQIFAVFLVFVLIGIIFVGSCIIVVINFVISCVCWSSVLSCWLSVLGVLGGQERLLQHSTLRSTHSRVAWYGGAIVVPSG